MEKIEFTNSQLNFYNRKRDESKEMSSGNNNYMFYYRGFDALKLNKEVIDNFGDYTLIPGWVESCRGVCEELDRNRSSLPKVVVPKKLVLYEDHYIGNVQSYYYEYYAIEKALRRGELSLEQRKLLLQRVKDILQSLKDCGFCYTDIHTENYIINRDLDVLQVDVDDANFIHPLTKENEKWIDNDYENFREDVLRRK